MELQNWADALLKKLSGVSYLAVLALTDEGFETRCEAGQTLPASNFSIAAIQALSNLRNLLAPADFDSDEIVEIIALPIVWEDSKWVIVAGLKKLPPRHVQLVMEQLDLASASVLLDRVKASLTLTKAIQHSQNQALVVLAEMLESTHPKESLHVLCNEIAQTLGAQRVSFVNRNWRGKPKLRVSSSVAKFDQRLELNSAIVEAANFSIQSSKPIEWLTNAPPPNALARLTRLHGDQAAVVIPLPYVRGDIGACLVIQWEERPAVSTLEEWKPLWLLAGPVVETIDKAHDGPLNRGLRKLNSSLLWLLGAEKLLLKLLLLTAVGIGSWLAFGKVEGSIKADARVIDASSISIVAPVEGFIENVYALPGQTVAAGDLLVKLEDDELQLEKLDQLAKIARYQAEEAVAKRDRQRGQAAIAKANMDSEKARLTIVEKQIELTEVKANVAAVVAQGDLRQRLGSRVDYGEALMELSPRQNTEVQITVDNKDYEQLQVNQVGSLRLKAYPSLKLPLKVIRIKPASESIDGEIKFVASAVLTDENPGIVLEPGMEGTARLSRGMLPGWKVWISPIIDSLTLFFWRWWP